METTYYASIAHGPRDSHDEVAEDNLTVGWTWEPLGQGVGLITVDAAVATAIDRALDEDGIYTMPGMGICATLVIEAP